MAPVHRVDPASGKRVPIRGLPLPPGQHYPEMPPDSELFAPGELAEIMREYGVDEAGARMVRSMGLV